MSETRPVTYKPAINAQTEIPVFKRLDVGIAAFDPGLPEEGSKDAAAMAIPKEVREAEAQFIAYHLKQTLESTG